MVQQSPLGRREKKNKTSRTIQLCLVFSGSQMVSWIVALNLLVNTVRHHYLSTQ